MTVREYIETLDNKTIHICMECIIYSEENGVYPTYNEYLTIVLAMISSLTGKILCENNDMFIYEIQRICAIRFVQIYNLTNYNRE